MPKPDDPYERIPPRDDLCYECWQYGKSVPKRPGKCPVCERRFPTKPTVETIDLSPEPEPVPSEATKPEPIEIIHDL